MEEVMKKKKAKGLKSQIKTPKGKEIKLNLRGVTPSQHEMNKARVKALKKRMGF
jgi:hypothetical protein